jgi:hypothetical protein
MKKGFRIEIQKNLSVDERKFAEDFCLNFIASKLSDNWGTGEYPTPLRRHLIGFSIPQWDENAQLVFRRISNNRRIFGVVKIDTLENIDGSDVVLQKYFYPRAAIDSDKTWNISKVRFRVKPEMDFFYERGEIKG